MVTIVARVGAVIVAAVGLYCLVGGLWLVGLGGSFYYAAAGLGYIAGGYLLFRYRASGAWLIAFIFPITLMWAVAERGFAFWPLMSRIMVPLGFAIAALALAPLLQPIDRPGFDWSRGRWPGWTLAGLCSFAFVTMLVLAFFPHGVVAPSNEVAFALAPGDNRPSDWTAYARTNAGGRFSPFNQIYRSNVSQLKIAWIYHTGDLGPGVNQDTPLQIGDTIYTCTPNDFVAAVDADTGKEKWRRDEHAHSPMWQRCRGLGYFKDAGAPPNSPCAERLINGTIDARLIALDAKTGKPCPGFGSGGAVDLKVGMGSVPPGYYFVTSAPMVARDKIVVGGWVVDNQQTGEPSGVIRAFDVRTGRLDWAWDLADPSIRKLPAPGKTYTRATPNMWTTPSFDDRLGLIYAPLGNETPDFYGMGRLRAADRYNSSLVAIDVETGRERWHVQTTHHDIWDYDLPSQPALVDVPDGHGHIIPAVLQETKRGELFLFNRATGAPVAPIVERPVPQDGAVPEERLSPTQPFSPGMPTIGAQTLTEETAWGMTMLDQLYCRISFRQHRYEGTMTPPGLKPAFHQPSNAGGLNWGSVTYDPWNNYAYVNDIRMPNEFWLVPRKDWAKSSKKYPNADTGHGPSVQKGTPYGVVQQAWVSPLGVPCSEPPFGTVDAIDLKTRKLVWSVPAGTSQDLGPLGITSHLPMPVGMPAYAGTMGTAGGLIFFSGFQEKYVRAYDAQTGATLWEFALPFGSSATPMTYISPRTGKQYVIVTAGGAAHDTTTSDYVIAFALPGSTSR